MLRRGIKPFTLHKDWWAVKKNSLKSLFLSPASVAFIGLPRRSGPGSLNPVDNLMRWGYKGRLHLVHPHVREIAGLQTVKSIASVNESVDLAVVSTPRETVPRIIRECAQKGIRAVIVTNQGFVEADSKGGELQKQIVEEARRGDLRVMGPNTLGVSNAFDCFTSSFMPAERNETPVGMICQSGVFFVGAANLLGGMGMGVDLGNACDLGFLEPLEWLGLDPRLKLIALHAEAFTGGARLLEVAGKVSRRLPVVALKTGRSPAGAKAATTHSGSMAGEDRIVDAAMLKTGMIRVDETEDMLDLVRGFVRLPRMLGRRIAVVTLTGAGGIILLDAMDACGATPAAVSADAVKRVQDLSPSWMPIGNPVDIWPALMKHGMQKVCRIALQDALRDLSVDGVICVALALEPPDHDHFSAIGVIQEVSLKFDKPIVVWCYGPRFLETAALLEEHGRAMAISSLERGVRLLARMARYEQWKRVAGQEPECSA